MEERQRCTYCSRFVMAVLVKLICSNNSVLVFWWCPSGEHRTAKNAQNISHRTLKELGVSLDDLPTVGDTESRVMCEVIGCERPGFEEHHWAQRGVFADAKLWPRSALCRYHHDLWHKRMEQYWRDKLMCERHGIEIGRNGGKT